MDLHVQKRSEFTIASIQYSFAADSCIANKINSYSYSRLSASIDTRGRGLVTRSREHNFMGLSMLDGSISRMAGSRQEVYRSVLLGMVAASSSSVGPPASEDISRKYRAMCVCKLLVLKFFFFVGSFYSGNVSMLYNYTI